MPEITVNGVIKYYEIDEFTGTGLTPDTLFIQHGMWRNLLFWQHWPPLLTAACQVIRHDLPGHGGSQDPGPDYPWIMEAIVDDIVAMLDLLEIDRVHFLGESTSGMLGVVFAVRHPQRLKSLILCASPTTIGPEAQKLFAFGHKDWQTAIRTLGAYEWGKALAGLGGTMGDLSPSEQEWVFSQIGRVSERAMVDYSLMVSNTDVEPLLQDIQIPTLILAPTRSVAAPLGQQQLMQQRIPGARLVEIDGAAHEIYRDCATECIAAIQVFIKEAAN